ncbi:MAG: hypothetical protein ACERKV_06925 [Clostridiaceae bacterium]
MAMQKDVKQFEYKLLDGFECKKINKYDIPNMVEVYKMVLKTCLFPIFDEEYIFKTMQENIMYFGIWDNGKLVGLSLIGTF